MMTVGKLEMALCVHKNGSTTAATTKNNTISTILVANKMFDMCHSKGACMRGTEEIYILCEAGLILCQVLYCSLLKGLLFPISKCERDMLKKIWRHCRSW